MPQKPTGIDWTGLPDQKEKTGIDWSGLPEQEEPKGFMGQLWDAVSKPLWEAPREWARETAMSMTDPRKRIQPDGSVRGMHPLASFGAGVLEGIGGVASDFTSPINIGATVASGGSYGAARAGLPQIARGLNTAARVVSAPVAVHGGMVATDPNASWAERAMGVAELAGGAAGMADPGPNLGPRRQPQPTNVPPPRPWNPREDIIDLGPDDYSIGDPFKPLQGRPQQPPAQLALPPAPQQPRAPMSDIDALIAELNGPEQIAPDAGFSLIDPDADLYRNNASGDSSASIEAMNRDRSMRDKGQQFMVFGRDGQPRPLLGVDAVDYAVRPGETYGIMNRDGSFQVLDDMGGRYPKTQPPNQQLQDFASQFDEMLPSNSLTDRPVEIRTMEELEARISDLEQKPALNAGGQRALDQMRSEVHKRRLMEQEQFEGVQDIDPNIPQGARTDSGGVKIGADVKSLGKVLGTSLYKGDIATIATKELMQNSLDAVRHLGDAGRINVNFDAKNSLLGVADNGKGMTPAEIQSIFTDLGSSGKRSDDEAIGGFGLAKAAPLLGGEHVEVRTVARDPSSGQLIETKFSGTPDELLEGVNMDTRIVPEGTETGTSVQVRVPKDKYGTSFHDAKDLVNRISRYSKVSGKVSGKETKTWGDGEENILEYEPATYQDIATLGDDFGNVTIRQPSTANVGDHANLNLHLMNKGMYQSTVSKWLNNPVPGIPNELMIDVDAKVPEGDANYPFTANRESLRGSIESLVSKYIDEEVLNPARKKHAAGLQELYDNMPSVITASGNKLYFHDTQAKLSPVEYQEMMNNPIIHSLGDQISTAISETLEAIRQTAPQSYQDAGWLDRLERVGLIFDEGLKGIHIPNPGKGSSAILINPFSMMVNKNPDSAAMGFIHTILHEIAHIDPGVRGHNENFAIRMSEVNEYFGARRTIHAQQQFLETVAPDGDYSPEVSEILRRYSDSRGRKATKEDILRRTGIDSKTETGSAKSGVKSPRASREGTSIILENGTPESTKRILEAGYKFKGMRDDGTLEFVPGDPGDIPILESETNRRNARPTPKNAATGGFPPGQGPPPRGRGPTPPSDGPSGSGSTPKFENTPEKRRWWVEAYNLPRALMASIDLSAPLRQGMTLIHKKSFWKALGPMINSWGSQRFYDGAMESIMQKPLFKARLQPNGKYARSFAEEAGLRFTDLKSLSTREEAIMSSWAEKIPGVGRAVKASNRAYTGFLNKLRADTFEQLMKDAKVFGADGTTNLPLARGLAEYVNNATGRGSLGSLEQSAVTLNSLLFSPRLIASRLKFLNPKTYWSSPAPVRKEYVKSLFAVAAVGNTVVQLGKLMGGDVDNNPNSSDYGKLKLGNVRLDPYAGFQQYIVAANRLLRPASAEIPAMRDVQGGPANLVLPIDSAAGWLGQGGQQMTSSTSGRQYDLWNQQGPFDPTWMDIATRFFRGKAHPVLGFALSIAMGAKEMDGSPMDFKTANPMENAVTQRFIPIFLQDLYELAQENPALLPILGPLTGSGMSIQTYGNDR